jgi:putative methionine-R-sulfoxide reductase with GAF domain
MDNRLSLLVKLAEIVGKEHDLQDLLDKMSLIAKDLVGADRCSIFIYDHVRHLLKSSVAHGVDGNITIPYGNGIVGYVAEHKCTEVVNDVQLDKRFKKEVDLLTGYTTKSILTLPIEDRDNNLLAVIQLLNKLDGKFDDEDVKTMHVLTEFLGLIIENALWRDDLEKRVEAKTEELQKIVNVLQFKVATDAQKSQKKDQVMALKKEDKAHSEMLSLIASQWELPLDELLDLSTSIKLGSELDAIEKSSIIIKMDRMNTIVNELTSTISLFKNYNRPKLKATLTDIQSLLKELGTRYLQGEVSPSDLQYHFNFHGKMVTNQAEFTQVISTIFKAIAGGYQKSIRGKKAYLNVNVEKSEETILIKIEECSDMMNDKIYAKMFNPQFTLQELISDENIALYMSKSIISEHLEGRMWVDLAEDKTIFFIELPLFI